MASPSFAKQNTAPVKEPAINCIQYPLPLARYEDVVTNPKLFMSTLENFHASMGTKFMIPIIGGKDLDLHRLFVEVTTRGGIEKVIRERRWKEVTAVFSFPSTATNASFVLRKYYGSLLHHYEQLYFFKARGWSPVSTVPTRSSLPTQAPAQVIVKPSPEYQAATAQQPMTNAEQLCGVAVRPASPVISPVMGVIDGKFESGYLVTVAIGSEKLKGVLYQEPHNQSCQVTQYSSIATNNATNVHAALGSQRRRRRKKHEIKRRDPAHPKPNRSGYNFFFAEQHARLKPLHLGKDREISRMIGELWNKLKESEKAVYQEKALKDKERYRIEMEDYRERLRTGRVVSDAVPLQQWLPEHESDVVEANVNDEFDGGDSHQTLQIENSSSESGSEEDNKAADMDIESTPILGLSADSGDVCMESSAEPDGFELSKKEENVETESIENTGTLAGASSETTVSEAKEKTSLIEGLEIDPANRTQNFTDPATLELLVREENIEGKTSGKNGVLNQDKLESAVATV